MAISKGSEILYKDIVDELDKKVNATDVLSLEEIQASTDVTGKIASAEAVRDSLSVSSYHNDGESIVIKIPPNFVIIITADGSDNHYLGLVAGYALTTIISKGYTIDNISISADRGEITLPRHSWYRYMIIK